MTASRLAVAIVVFALAGATPAFAADEEKKSDPHHHHPAPKQSGDKPKSDTAPMSRLPAPASGSMPKGAAPSGKLGTEPTARGKLGTDPKPGESSKPPPRLN